jgi:hypothetical protein
MHRRRQSILSNSEEDAPSSAVRLQPNSGDNIMSLGTILLIVLVIALLGGFSGLGGGSFYGTGYTAAADSAVLILVSLNREYRPLF